MRSFSPWELPASEETTTDDTQEYVYEPPQITELLAVNAQTLPLFSRLGLRLVQLSILEYYIVKSAARLASQAIFFSDIWRLRFISKPLFT